MVKKYRTNGRAIAVVEVSKETEQSVWVDGRRNAKRSEYYNFFDTWDEAHENLKDRAQRKVVSARRSLDFAMEDLEKIIAMRKPEVC